MIYNLEFIPLGLEPQFETPLWSFDFNPMADIMSEIDLDYNGALVEGLLPISGRQVYDINKSEMLLQFRKNWNNFIVNKLTEMFFEETIFKIFKSRWPIKKENFLNAIAPHTVIFQDPAKFSMQPHLDNQSVIANVIVNLKDNDTSTTFYDYRDHNKILYQGSGKANTGIIFLNTPGSLHSVKNNFDSTRYILYTSVLLKGNWY